jgi:hypothetical protein
VPPSDTLEPLPAGFWAEALEAPPDPERGAADPAGAPADEGDADAARPAALAGGGTVAMLQRLFPGRVLRIDAAEPSDGAGDAATEPPPLPAGDTSAAADQDDDEAGLESPGSRMP